MPHVLLVDGRDSSPPRLAMRCRKGTAAGQSDAVGFADLALDCFSRKKSLKALPKLRSA
jgi:hypothetical protein